MIQWFKRHPQILQSESAGLSQDSNYKEIFQKRDTLLISHGYIVVRLKETHRFPILIIYPPAYPYVLPLIYPLNRVLSEEEVNNIASDINGVPPPGTIQYYYNLRHQNNSGILCFLEWESFDDGGQFYGITSIIQRVRDWYTGHITGVFPPEGEEVAFSSHFNNVSKTFQLIYPYTFVEHTAIQGEFYATIMCEIPKQRGGSLFDAIFTGLYIAGVNTSALSTDPPITLNVPPEIKERGLETSLDLLAKPDVVQQLVNEGELTEGIWFDVDTEPAPFRQFSELVDIIGNGRRDCGIQRLAEIGYEKLKKLPNILQVAIRFPNRKGQKEFQSFFIHKIATPEGLPLFTTPIETIGVAIRNYEAVDAVICEKFTEDTFFQRNSTRADRRVLKKCCVNIVGVGALGSEIADCMGKSGVDGINLIDNQRMGIHNIVRHLTGIRTTGFWKVDAVALRLKEHNPFLQIESSQQSVTACNIATELPEDSITISSIADDNIENFLNEQSVIVKRPMFYIRALRGGKVGRIVRVIPGKDACLNCLRLYRKDGGDFIEIPIDQAYPVQRNECNNPIHPASAADLKLIAALGSRLLIDYLQSGPCEFNHWLWSTETIADTPLTQPFSLNEQHFIPHPRCQFCQNDLNAAKSVTIDSSVLGDLKNQVQAMAGTETGGVLAGYKDETGNFFITHGSGPGPKAKHSRYLFEKDIEFCQKFLDDLWAQSEGKIMYLGEWHSHPTENNTPSNTDLRSLTEISLQGNYVTGEPLMIIFTSSGVPSLTIHPAGKIYRNIQLDEQNLH